MLDECKASVQAQTYHFWEHLVAVDHDGLGCGRMMNFLAEHAAGRWLLPLADDDLLLPGALAELVDVADPAASHEIVYGPPLVSRNGDTHFWQDPPFIPSFALIPTSLWRMLGGYREDVVREEDRDLWRRAIGAGAEFVRIDEPVWVYRFHFDDEGRPGNKSYNHGVAR